jgi:c(7)-type cytochrome triheme protein
MRHLAWSVAASAALSLVAHVPALGADSSEKVAVPPELRLPDGIVYEKGAGKDQAAVTFRHETHVDLSLGTCLACHPEPFRLVRPIRAASHQEMDAGMSCGSCHDGKKAFGTADPASCEACHAGAADPGARVKDVAFRSSASSPGAVAFRHGSHSFGGCTACHPSTFIARAGGTRVASPQDLHGRCGVCHDGSTAFGVENPDACQRCHAAEGAKP